MTTPERRTFVGSICKGSIEDFEISCEPCEEDGNFVEALGYCQNFNEYLCLACFKTHCRPKPCRHHVVLDKQHMPTSKPRKANVSMCTETCDNHPTECLKFYCKKHEVTGCGDCMIHDHKTCEVDYISTLSAGYNSSKEFVSIIQHVESLTTEINCLLLNVEHNASKADLTIQKAFNDIKQYRNEVVACFDKAERILAAKCDEVNKGNQHESGKIKEKFESTKNELTAIQGRLTRNVEDTGNLFVKAKESQSVLTRIEQEIEDIKKVQLKSVEFIKNITFTTDKATYKYMLGTLQVSDLPTTLDLTCAIPEHKSDISIGEKNDKKHCYITGMVHVKENIIACTDCFNKAVKLVDIEQNKLLFTVLLMNSPWDITCITINKLAVTHPLKHTVQFLELKNGVLSEGRLVDVGGECRGIDCIDDKFVVSFTNPGKVEILDLNGTRLKLMQTNIIGNDLFKCPYYVAVSRDGGSFFVADNQNNCVVKVSFVNDTVRSFRSAHLEKPQGMFVCQDGSLLVCTLASVLVMSQDCKGHKAILTEEDGMNLPTAICSNEDNGILCLRKDGDDSSDTIQTYRLVRPTK